MHSSLTKLYRKPQDAEATGSPAGHMITGG